MRYDTKVIFSEPSPGSGYNPDTGMIEALPGVQHEQMCRVYDLSTERKLQVYGRANVRAVTIYHLGESLDKATSAVIGGIAYHITDRRQVRGKASYICEEAKA